MHVEIMKAFACKPLKLSSNKVLVLGSIKGAKEPNIFADLTLVSGNLSQAHLRLEYK